MAKTKSGSGSKKTGPAGKKSGSGGGKRRLGRGLSSLMAAKPVAVELPRDEDAVAGQARAAKGARAAGSGEMAAPARSEKGGGGSGGSSGTIEVKGDGAARAAVSPGADSAMMSDDDDAVNEGGVLRQISVGAVEPNPHQPRRVFDEDALRGLAESISTAGLMQPIVVRLVSPDAELRGTGTGSPDSEARGTTDGPSVYQLIAGERRWRAAQMAGLERVPAIVRQVDDQTAAEWALIENLQREDLNPVERAQAFSYLSEEFGLTHAEIAETVGVQRSTVTNHLRLLELDEYLLGCVEQGGLSMGQARALLGSEENERTALALLTMQNGWSVRRLEEEIRQGREEAIREAEGNGRRGAAEGVNRLLDDGGGKKGRELHPQVARLQSQLSEHLGTGVEIRPGKKKGTGKVVVSFYSLEQFEGLLGAMGYVEEA